MRRERDRAGDRSGRLGWRALYGVLVLAGLALVFAVLIALPETSPRAEGHIGEAYLRVLRLRRTIPLAFLVALEFGAHFALISGSRFALAEQMHVPTNPYALAFAINACALLAGSVGAGRLARRVGPERLFASVGSVVLCGTIGAGLGYLASRRPSP